MPQGDRPELTQLLLRWQGGDLQALDALVPIVYSELRTLARRYIGRERPGHTLQSTALVHEVYARMVQQELPQWQNRAHFFGVAAQLMRQVLVDYARTRRAQKRGGDVQKLSLDAALDLPQPVDVDIVALDDALTTLAAMDARQGRIVELKFFAGLSNEDASEVLGISPATLKRDWVSARAWLYRELSARTAI